MSKDYVEFEIRGMAPRTDGDSMRPWRNYIAEKAKEKRIKADLPTSHRKVNASTCFEISLVFYLLKVDINNRDLDNLAKPVLDTIFHSQGSSHPHEALYDIDDSAVWKLHLEKREAPSEEKAGVSMRITIL